MCSTKVEKQNAVEVEVARWDGNCGEAWRMSALLAETVVSRQRAEPTWPHPVYISITVHGPASRMLRVSVNADGAHVCNGVGTNEMWFPMPT